MSRAEVTLDSALEDVEARFLFNLPESELSQPDRLFFQIEQAWWFYEDFKAAKVRHWHTLEKTSPKLGPCHLTPPSLPPPRPHTVPSPTTLRQASGVRQEDLLALLHPGRLRGQVGGALRRLQCLQGSKHLAFFDC